MFTALSSGPPRVSSMSAPLWKICVVEGGTCSAAARPELRLLPVQSATRFPAETALRSERSVPGETSRREVSNVPSMSMAIRS